MGAAAAAAAAAAISFSDRSMAIKKRLASLHTHSHTHTRTDTNPMTSGKTEAISDYIRSKRMPINGCTNPATIVDNESPSTLLKESSLSSQLPTLEQMLRLSEAASAAAAVPAS